MKNKLQLLFDKKKKQGYKVIFVIFISLILTNICMEMILFNSNNLKTGLLDNNRLMLLQMFGKDEEKNTCFIDKEIIKKVDHVLFVTESFPIVICLYDKKKKIDIGEDVCVHKIPKNYGQYVGIENMENGVIYCPKGSLNEDVLKSCSLEKKYEKLNLRIEGYDVEAPQILEGEQFVTEETFDKIMEIERASIGEENANVVYSTPEYLIGVEKTENVYDVIDDLKDNLPNYNVNIFSQASGLQSFVSGATNMITLQIVVASIIFVVSFVIIYALLTSMINKIEKNMMVLYINGMTRKEITNQVFIWLIKMLMKPIVCAFALSFVAYILLSILVFQTGFILKHFVIIMFINIFDVCMNMVFIKLAVQSKINNRTSNDRISGILRN